MLKYYDFIEIGTCDWGTMIEDADENTVGISVEPIKIYLDRLPNKSNVKKVNVAITDVKESDNIDIYWVHPDNIQKHGLGGWLGGCNSVGKPHEFHIAYHPNPGYWHRNPDIPIAGLNLVDAGIVVKESVPVLTFTELAKENEIGKVRYIKIDTEGHDPNIVRSILEYYDNLKTEQNMDIYPDTIYFESNRHTKKTNLENIKKELSKRGYKLAEVWDDGHPANTIATLENTDV